MKNIFLVPLTSYSSPIKKEKYNCLVKKKNNNNLITAYLYDVSLKIL